MLLKFIHFPNVHLRDASVHHFFCSKQHLGGLLRLDLACRQLVEGAVTAQAILQGLAVVGFAEAQEQVVWLEVEALQLVLGVLVYPEGMVMLALVRGALPAQTVALESHGAVVVLGTGAAISLLHQPAYQSAASYLP